MGQALTDSRSCNDSFGSDEEEPDHRAESGWLAQNPDPQNLKKNWVSPRAPIAESWSVRAIRSFRRHTPRAGTPAADEGGAQVLATAIESGESEGWERLTHQAERIVSTSQQLRR